MLPNATNGKYCKACHKTDHIESMYPNRESKAHGLRISGYWKNSEKKNTVEYHVPHLDTTLEDEENSMLIQVKESKYAKCAMLVSRSASEMRPYNGVLLIWNKTLVKLLGVC